MTEYQVILEAFSLDNSHPIESLSVFSRSEATARYIAGVAFPGYVLHSVKPASFYSDMKDWSVLVEKHGEGYIQKIKGGLGLKYVRVDTRGMKLHNLGI